MSICICYVNIRTLAVTSLENWQLMALISFLGFFWFPVNCTKSYRIQNSNAVRHTVFKFVTDTDIHNVNILDTAADVFGFYISKPSLL